MANDAITVAYVAFVEASRVENDAKDVYDDCLQEADAAFADAPYSKFTKIAEKEADAAYDAYYAATVATRAAYIAYRAESHKAAATEAVEYLRRSDLWTL
jgi:hypothetical protein